MPAQSLPEAGALAIATTPAAAREVADVLARVWQLNGTLDPVAGERDTNFRLDSPQGRFLVKVTHPHEARAAVEAQTAVLPYLEAHARDLPVQRLIAARDGAVLVPYPPDPRRVVRVVRYLDGELRRHRPWHDALAPAIGALAGQLDAALSGFTHPGCTQDLLWDLRRAPQLVSLLPHLALDPIDASVRSCLERFADCAPVLAAAPLQAIHNDLNPSNLLLNEDGQQVCGLIDFGDMIMAPAVIELAVACAYLTDASDLVEAIRECTRAYVTYHPLPPDSLAVLPDLIATRWAMTILITEWRARLQPENAPYILRNNPAARHGLLRLDGSERARLSNGLKELTA